MVHYCEALGHADDDGDQLQSDVEYCLRRYKCGVMLIKTDGLCAIGRLQMGEVKFIGHVLLIVGKPVICLSCGHKSRV